MSHQYALEDPIVRVVLDLVYLNGPCGWYRVCNTVSLHPWFVDFSLGDGFHALKWLDIVGMVARQGEDKDKYSITGTGEYCLGRMKQQDQ